jgi:hypothetical protein
MKSLLKLNEEQLKEEHLSWLESIKIRRIAYEQATANLKQKEKELKIAKKIFYLTYRDWKQARKEAEKSKKRWKSYPSRLREWAKRHWGEVFKILENANNG